MKKLFIMAIAASVAFTACLKNEPTTGINAGQNGAKIAFEEPILAPSVKSLAGYTAINPTTDDFKVWAFFTANELATTGLTQDVVTNSVYINQATVAYVQTGTDSEDNPIGQWEAGAYYWPQNGYLSFLGYLPATPSSGTFTVTAEGLQIEDYTTDGDEDLLVSEIVYDQTKQTAMNSWAGPVQMSFKHALSALKFTVATDLEDMEVALQSITLKNVYSTGDFNAGLSSTKLDLGNASATGTGAEYTETNVCWTADATTATNYLVYPVGCEAGLLVTDSPAETAATPGQIDLIVVPQTLRREGVILEVVYTLKNASMVTPVTQTVTAPITLPGAPSGWLRGYRYTYNLNIQLDKITFTPVVEDWIDYNGGAASELIGCPTWN